jgi:hypothetical protein
MLEPRIIYGSFDYDGMPTQPGGNASAIGYGVVHGWTGGGIYSIVAESPDDLGYEVDRIKAEIAGKMAVKRFDEMEDKRALFVGIPIYSTDLYTDQWNLSLSMEGSRRTAVFTFGSMGITYGMKTRDQIRDAIGYYGTRTIASWEGDIIMLDNGFQFAIAPRYAETADLVVTELTDTWKRMLVLNLDKRLAAEDSAPAPTVQ